MRWTCSRLTQDHGLTSPVTTYSLMAAYICTILAMHTVMQTGEAALCTHNEG